MELVIVVFGVAIILLGGLLTIYKVAIEVPKEYISYFGIPSYTYPRWVVIIETVYIYPYQIIGLIVMLVGFVATLIGYAMSNIFTSS